MLSENEGRIYVYITNLYRPQKRVFVANYLIAGTKMIHKYTYEFLGKKHME